LGSDAVARGHEIGIGPFAAGGSSNGRKTTKTKGAKIKLNLFHLYLGPERAQFYTLKERKRKQE
jgi:hypothetical protein